MKNCNVSSELLLLLLTNYYRKNIEKLYHILPIICKTSHISLRLIDWFVTNYCKKHNIVFLKYKSEYVDEYFNVYSNYRSQLKAFKKIQFDPFRRRERIDFYYTEQNFFETTIGQLNFFRWFVDNELLEYVIKYAKEIEEDMLSSNNKKNKTNYDAVIQSELGSENEKSNVSSENRLHVSKAMIKQMTKYNGMATITFG